MSNAIAAVFKLVADPRPPVTLLVDVGITMEDLRLQWESHSGVSSEDLFFVLDGSARPLPSAGSLASFLPEDAFHAAISVQPKLELVVSCCCISGLRWTLPLLWQTTAADVLSDARFRLQLPERSAVRLVSENRIIPADDRLKDFRDSCGALAVEVDVQVSVKAQILNQRVCSDPDDCVIEQNVFLSSPACALMPSEEKMRCLSFDRQRAVSAERRFGELLQASDLTDVHVPVFIELPMTLFVTTTKDNAVREVRVWPTDSLGALRTSPDLALRFNGETLADSEASFRELGLFDGSFVEAVELVQVAVHDCRWGLRAMELDRDMRFSELLLQLSAHDPKDALLVSVEDSIVLSSPAPLRHLGLGEGSNIRVRRAAQPLRGELKDTGCQTDTDDRFRSIGSDDLTSRSQITIQCGREVEKGAFGVSRGCSCPQQKEEKEDEAGLANFRVVCCWNLVEEIYLSLPPPVLGHQLLSAVREEKSQVARLTQWRERDRITGKQAVDMGNHVYADEDGEQAIGFVNIGNYVIDDDETLLIPGNRHALIFAQI